MSALFVAWSGSILPQQGGTSADRDGAVTQRDRSAQPDRTTGRQRERADKDDRIARGDRRMMETIARKNMAEVKLGELARQNASSEQVKNFAEKMVKEHTRTGEELRQMAAQENVTLPEELDRSHRRASDRLAKLKGAEFDRRYMEQMVEDHESTLKDLRNAAKDARDPELKAFAEKAARHVEEHLREARQIATAVGAKGGDRSASTGAGPMNRQPASTGQGDSSGNK